MAVRLGNAKGVPSSALGDLYERWTLDVITTNGEICAHLFRNSPNRFKGVKKATADSLARLAYRVGNSEEYLNAAQRASVLQPLLGPSEGANTLIPSDSSFHQASGEVRASASRFVERAYDTGEAQLRSAFKDSATTLKQYLSNIVGQVSDDAMRRITPHFDETVSVLQDATFTSGLGLPPAPVSPWPLDGNFDGAGSQLINEITGEAAALDMGGVVNDATFLHLQRVAFYGALTIDFVLDASLFSDNAKTDKAIGFAYQWQTALSGLPEHKRKSMK